MTNRHLLWISKNKAKEQNWKYVWIKDGRILAKKDDGARVIQVAKEGDVNLIH